MANSKQPSVAIPDPFATPIRPLAWGLPRLRVLALLHRRLDLPQALDGGAALLRFDPALARAPGGLGRPARNRRHGRALDQFDEAIERVRAVALLGAVALRGDHQHALACQSPAGEALEPDAHVAGEVRRAAHVEAELHRA